MFETSINRFVSYFDNFECTLGAKGGKFKVIFKN